MTLILNTIFANAAIVKNLIYLNCSNLVVYRRLERIKEFRMGRFFILYEILKSFPKYKFFLRNLFS